MCFAFDVLIITNKKRYRYNRKLKKIEGKKVGVFMVLKYEEIRFFNNDNYYVLCTLNTFGKFKFSNLEHVYNPQKNIYCFDIALALFENLTNIGISYIDNIFGKKETENRYINEKGWRDHKHSEEYEINEYGEYRRPDVPDINLGRPLCYVNFCTDEEAEIKRELYEDGEIKLTENEINNLYKTQPRKKGRKKYNSTKFSTNKEQISNFCKRMSMLHGNNINWSRNVEEYTCYSVKIENEIELIRYFFELVFSSQVKFRIKKCEICEKYFITKDTHKQKCDRVYDNISCAQYSTSINGYFEKKSPIYILEERVRSKCRHNSTKYDTYLEEKYEMKRKYKDEPQKYVNWLLNHYDSEKKREEIISKIDGLKEILEKI